MTTSELAEKYISEHNSPMTKKLELFGLKQHLSSLTEDEECRREKCLNEIENSLRRNRVDRRLVRSIAEWLPQEKVAKVTKITSASAAFGIQNKFGKFLNAEEALFLLEINKLELFCENVSVSVEEAFKNIENLQKYQAYKQLWLQGHKLKRGNRCKDSLKEEEETDEPPTKVARIMSCEDNSMGHIFESLRHSGPKSFKSDGCCRQTSEYSLPSSTERGKSFNVIVENGKEFSSKVDGQNMNIYALSSDDVAFYRFYNTEIPII